MIARPDPDLEALRARRNRVARPTSSPAAGGAGAPADSPRRTGLRVAAFLWLAFSVGACGTSAPVPSGRPPLAASAITTDSPPSVSPSGMIGGASFGASSRSGAVLSISPLGGDTCFEVTLGSETAILLAAPKRVAGVEYLLVGAVNASGEFTLYRFHDHDEDRILDPATQTVVFTTAPHPCYMTEVASFGTHWYFLDCRTQDIRLVVDTSHDGFPDSIQPEPFAMSDTYPHLRTIGHISADGPGVVLASRGPMTEREAGVLAHARYEDPDGDGVADQETLVPEVAGAPRVRGHLYAGQRAVAVKLAGAPLQEVQIWRLDAERADDILLGSGMPSKNEWTLLPLSPGLSEGECVGIRFLGRAASQRVLAVGPAHPEVLEHRPPRVVIGTTTSIALVGQNFTPTMAVVLETASGALHPLGFTFTDPERITVMLPHGLTDDDAGAASLIAIPSTPEADSGRVYPFDLGTAEDARKGG